MVITELLHEAECRKFTILCLKHTDIHRKVKLDNRYANVRQVMMSEMDEKHGDFIARDDRDNGLVVCYKLPRPKH